MRVVMVIIVVVALLIGVPLARNARGGGAGMVVFALLAVIFFASLPVLTGVLASKRSSRESGAPVREAIDLDRPSEGASGGRV